MKSFYNELYAYGYMQMLTLIRLRLHFLSLLPVASWADVCHNEVIHCFFCNVHSGKMYC